MLLLGFLIGILFTLIAVGFGIFLCLLFRKYQKTIEYVTKPKGKAEILYPPLEEQLKEIEINQ